MKNIVIIFFFALCTSCNSNSQTKGYEIFKKELSKESIEIIAKNSPYSFADRIVADYKFYPYYQKFGNSGVCIQFNIPKEDEKSFKSKLKLYKQLENNSISYNDKNYVYVYSDQNTNIEVPELTEEIGDLSSVKLNNPNEVEMYVTESGKLPNVFMEGEKRVYNYSIGIYHFKKRSTFIYWFLIY